MGWLGLRIEVHMDQMKSKEELTKLINGEKFIFSSITPT